MIKQHTLPVSVRKLPTDEGLLFLDTSSNRLVAYNYTARHVWDLIAQGCSEYEVAADLTARHGISADVARKDVAAVLMQWRSHGIILEDGQNRPCFSRGSQRSSTDWRRAAPPNWAATLTCTIRNKVFTLAVEPIRAVTFAQVLFGHLQTPNSPADVRLEVREAGRGESALVVDGTERFRTHDEGQLIGAVNQTILEHIHPGVEWLAMIHGGAIARDNAALILPAPRGSGKTTLIAHLLPQGFDYLADDLIALSKPDGRIVPWPLPLSIKAGSWDLLSERYQDLPSFPQYKTQRGDARQLVPSAEAWETDPVSVRGVLFPRYASGVAAKLTRITPFEALARLLQDKVWLGYPITEANVLAFLAWLGVVPRYTMVYGNLGEAASLVEGIAH